MDLKQYFRRLREVESALSDRDVLIVSVDTSDGGKAGIVTEAPKSIAARMIVEGRAVIASEAEAEEFRLNQRVAREAIERAEAAKRVQVTILRDTDLHSNSPAKRDFGSLTGK